MSKKSNVEIVKALKTIPVKGLRGCARCGKGHKLLNFRKLRRGTAHTHWAMCPNTREPIILKVIPI